MSVYIYGLYDSADAAGLAAGRLKRSVKGLRVAGISKREMPDKSEEMTLYAFPVFDPNLSGPGSEYSASIPGNNYVVDSMNDKNLDQARHGGVNLRVEAPDRNAAQAASAIMRSMGGKEVRQVER
jgi:hypothetical protein